MIEFFSGLAVGWALHVLRTRRLDRLAAMHPLERMARAGIWRW